MVIAGALCSIIGALLSAVAAVWLVFGFNPLADKYKRIEGGGYSQSDPVGLRLLLRDQARAAGLAAAGASLQLVGVVLTVMSD
jgi:hypothetical protein